MTDFVKSVLESQLETGKAANTAVKTLLKSHHCCICGLLTAQDECSRQCKRDRQRREETERRAARRASTMDNVDAKHKFSVSPLEGSGHVISNSESEIFADLEDRLQKQVENSVEKLPGFGAFLETHSSYAASSPADSVYDFEALDGVPLLKVGIERRQSEADDAVEVLIRVCHTCWIQVLSDKVPKFAPWNNLLVGRWPSTLFANDAVLSAFSSHSTLASMIGTPVSGTTVKSLASIVSLGRKGGGGSCGYLAGLTDWASTSGTGSTARQTVGVKLSPTSKVQYVDLPSFHDVADFLRRWNAIFHEQEARAHASLASPNGFIASLLGGEAVEAAPSHPVDSLDAYFVEKIDEDGSVFLEVAPCAGLVAGEAGIELYGAFVRDFPFGTGGPHEPRIAPIGRLTYWRWFLRSWGASDSLLAWIYSEGVVNDLRSSLRLSLAGDSASALANVTPGELLQYLAYAETQRSAEVPSNLKGKEEALSGVKAVYRKKLAGGAAEKKGARSAARDLTVSNGAATHLLTVSPGLARSGRALNDIYSVLGKGHAQATLRSRDLKEPVVHAQSVESGRKIVEEGFTGSFGGTFLGVHESTSALRTHCHYLWFGADVSKLNADVGGWFALYWVKMRLLQELEAVPDGLGGLGPHRQWLLADCETCGFTAAVLKNDAVAASMENQKIHGEVCAVIMCVSCGGDLSELDAMIKTLRTYFTSVLSASPEEVDELMSSKFVSLALDRGETVFGPFEDLCLDQWVGWSLIVAMTQDLHNHGPWCVKKQSSSNESGGGEDARCRFGDPVVLMELGLGDVESLRGALAIGPLPVAGLSFGGHYLASLSSAGIGASIDVRVLTTSSSGADYVSKVAGSASSYIGKTGVVSAEIRKAREDVASALERTLRDGKTVSVWGLAMLISRKTHLAGYPLPLPLAATIAMSPSSARTDAIVFRSGDSQVVKLNILGALRRLKDGDGGSDGVGSVFVAFEGRPRTRAMDDAVVDAYQTRDEGLEDVCLWTFCELYEVVVDKNETWNTRRRAKAADVRLLMAFVESMYDLLGDGVIEDDFEGGWRRRADAAAVALILFAPFRHLNEFVESSSIDLHTRNREIWEAATRRFFVNEDQRPAGTQAQAQNLNMFRLWSSFLGKGGHGDSVGGLSVAGAAGGGGGVTAKSLEGMEQVAQPPEFGGANCTDAACVSDERELLQTEVMVNGKGGLSLDLELPFHSVRDTDQDLKGTAAGAVLQSSVLFAALGKLLGGSVSDVDGFVGQVPQALWALMKRAANTYAAPLRRGGVGDEGLQSLSDEQRMVFEDIRVSVQVSQGGEAASSIHVVGQGGCGKSFLVNAMRAYFTNSFVCATTGSAAMGLSGVTLHKYLGISISTKEGFERLADDSGRDVSLYAKEASQLAVLFLDESSMLTPQLLVLLHLSLCKWRNEWFRPFGGVIVCLSGDPLQLSPVNAVALWDLQESHAAIPRAAELLNLLGGSESSKKTTAVIMRTASSLFWGLTVRVLTSNFRSEDMAWTRALGELRGGEPFDVHTILSKRCIGNLSEIDLLASVENMLECQEEGRNFAVITRRNHDRAMIANLAFQSLTQSCESQTQTQRQMEGWRFVMTVNGTPVQDDDSTREKVVLGQLATSVVLLKGQPVYVVGGSENQNVNAGVGNGSRGTFVGILEAGQLVCGGWPSPKEVVTSSKHHVLLVHFATADDFPWDRFWQGDVAPGPKTWPVPVSSVRRTINGTVMKLEQVGVFPSIAQTTWTVQGLELSGALVAPMSLSFGANDQQLWSLMYVAISRVRSPERVLMVTTISEKIWSRLPSGARYILRALEAQSQVVTPSSSEKERARNNPFPTRKRMKSATGEGRMKKKRK